MPSRPRGVERALSISLYFDFVSFALLPSYPPTLLPSNYANFTSG
jgi:hypothetical protein